MKLKFLMADDDSDDVAMFEEVLSDIDRSIVFERAWEGQEVLKKLKSRPGKYPDIIFLDINMPGMGGWECLAELKSHKSFKDIPVIIYSTSTEEKDVEIAYQLGAACFITKPYRFKDLEKIMKIIVDNVGGNLSEGLSKASHFKEVKCGTGKKKLTRQS